MGKISYIFDISNNIASATMFVEFVRNQLSSTGFQSQESQDRAPQDRSSYVTVNFLIKDEEKGEEET